MERVPFVEIAGLLGRSKVGLNYHPLDPHLEAALPVKIFEYLGAGCAVVSSDFPYLRTIMDGKCPVIFLKHEPGAFVTRLRDLFCNPEELAALSGLSREFSFKFQWKNEEIKMIESYGGFLK